MLKLFKTKGLKERADDVTKFAELDSILEDLKTKISKDEIDYEYYVRTVSTGILNAMKESQCFPIEGAVSILGSSLLSTLKEMKDSGENPKAFAASKDQLIEMVQKI